jgi:voltage-gated potassium channel
MNYTIRLKVALVSVGVVILIGAIGYRVIEDWPWFDSLYLTTLLLASFGFAHFQPISEAGKAFTIFLALCGVAVIAFAIASMTQLIIGGQIEAILGRRKMLKEAEKLWGHYIVCGYGRMGRMVAKELMARPLPVVIVEKDPAVVALMDRDEINVVEGDATLEETLMMAGVQRARGLISAVSSDAENLYIVLSARGLNKDLLIVARAGEEKSEQKLMRAGANKVISPYVIGGMRIAQAVLRPNVVDFIELATQSEHMELQMEEIPIQRDSKLSGRTLKDSGIRIELGIIVVAIKKKTGHMEYNPPAVYMIQGEDTLIVLGQPERIKVLEKLASP